jgi:hypothetical protein
MSFLNNNMPSIYNIRKTSLPLTFCKHKVYPDFLWNQIYWLYSLKLALYICTLPFILVFLLNAHLDPLGFIPTSGSTKFQTWLVHKVHSFKSFLGINIIYYLQVIGRLINYDEHVIHSCHEMFLSHWCMICPTKFIKILCFLRFRLNI